MSSLRFLDLSLALDSREDMPITDCEWVNGGNGDGTFVQLQPPTSLLVPRPHQFPAFRLCLLLV